MTDRDPLATPTLARLYMGQGHHDHARTVLDTCLRRDPFDGHALALVARLRARSDASLLLAHHGDRLLLRWAALSHSEACHVVLVAMTSAAATCATWVTSTRARAAFGAWECALPFPRGSATACITAVDAQGLAVRAVARSVSWPA